MDSFMETLVEFATTYGIRVVGAIALLIVGRIAAGLVRRGVQRLLKRGEADPAIVSFASSLAYYLVLVVVIMAGMGAGLGLIFDKAIGLLGIQLGRLEHHE